MTGNLFKPPEGIEPGQIWVDLALEEKDEPHPMRRVKVQRIDDAGMIVLSSVMGSAINDYHISPKALRRDYRMEEP